MGDHYVPRAYLRGFCEAGSEMIFAYEKGSRRCFRSNVINVAQERGFYPEEVEKRLAIAVEDPANLVIRKIRNREQLADGDKVALAYYMAVMMQRVPRHRQRLAAIAPGVMEETFADVYAHLKAAKNLYPQYANNIDHQLMRVAELQEESQKALPPSLVNQVQRPWPTPNVVAAIAAMAWRFGSEGPSCFLANDNPLFFFECWGVGREESEIAFPLSTAIAIHASFQGKADLEYMPMKQALVKEINRRNALSATRFLFYHREEAWVKVLSEKQRDVQELSRIVWTD